MRHLQRPLPGLKLSAVLGREVSDLAEAFALPPVRIRGIDHCDLVPSLKIQLVGVARLEVVKDHVQVGWQKTLMLLKKK